jgi:hypothetical protein
MELLDSLWNVIVAVALLVWALLLFLAPWTPLLAWIAFWLFAVNWRQLSPILMKGGWIGVLLIAWTAILVWSSVSVPADGYHSLYGLQVSNVVGKTVYVTSLVVIALLCGSVQLAGCCSSLCRMEEEPQASSAAH